MAPGDGVIVDEHIALGAAFFWHGGGAWVHVAMGAVGFVGWNVGVAVEQNALRGGQRWQGTVVVEMAVGDEHWHTGQPEIGVVGHTWEVEHHLVYFGVTVAAHGDDVVFVFVQKCGNHFWIVAFRQEVAWAVVEKVAEQHEHIGVGFLEAVEQELGAVFAAVNIRCNKVFHE